MAKRYKIMKRNRIVLFILILIATSITLCAESKEQFINVGNIKIIRGSKNIFLILLFFILVQP